MAKAANLVKVARLEGPEKVGESGDFGDILSRLFDEMLRANTILAKLGQGC